MAIYIEKYEFSTINETFMCDFLPDECLLLG